MPGRKNWRRSEARRSLLRGSPNKPAELTPELTPDVMQVGESVMTKGLFEARPVSVQAAASPDIYRTKMKIKINRFTEKR